MPPLARAADHRLGLDDRAGRVRGAADRHAPAERAVEQGGGREQIGVAVALDDAVGKAGDDRALRHDAARHALEPDLRFAGGQGDRAGLADQRIAVQPAEIAAPAPARGRDRDRW